MNRNQMNLSEMLRTLEEFLTKNLSSFENKQAIMSVINELKTKNAEIESLKLSQSVSTQADYEIKDSDEEVLIATAVKVSDGLKVIAATTNNARLKIDAKISQWDLSRMRKDNMYVRLKQLNVAALPYGDQLEPLGITKSEVDSLDVESTRLLKVKPEINIIQGKTTKATNDLGETITYINGVVREKLDLLMLEFKLLNPSLYSEYLIARKVNNRAAGHSSKDTKEK